MKIFVAIPVYDGKLQAQTVKCLLSETTIANGNGDDLRVNFMPSCSVPAHGRNQLVQHFMDSDCDKLFFLDSDITFPLGAIVKLAHQNADVVGGCYRLKENPERYPIDWLEKEELWADKNGLLEVKMLPTGFLCISRNAFEMFKKQYPGREYDHQGHEVFCYFQMIFQNGNIYSEDTYFCKEWKDMGGKIYLDPEIGLTHWDVNPTSFAGHIGNWLKNRNHQPKGQTNVIPQECLPQGL